MTDTPGSESVLLEELAKALQPIGEAARAAARGDSKPLADVLEGMGLHKTALGETWETVETEIQRLGDAWETIEQSVVEPAQRDEAPELENIDEIIDAIGTVFDVVSSLGRIQIPDPEVDDLGERILDYLLITYLADHHVLVYAGFSLLGVIDTSGPGTVGDLDLSKLVPALKNPNAAMQSGFEWGTESFEPYLVLFYVKGVLGGFGLDAEFAPVSRENRREVQGLGPNESWPGLESNRGSTQRGESNRGSTQSGTTQSEGDSGNAGGLDPRGPAAELADDKLVVDVLSLAGSGFSLDADVYVFPVPGAHGTLPGLAVMPVGMGQGDISEDLGSGWTFNASFSAETEWALRVRPRKSGGVETDTVPARGVDEELHGEAELTYDPQEQSQSNAKAGDGTANAETGEDAGTTVLSNGEGTSLSIDYFRAYVRIDYDGDEPTVDVQVPIRGTFDTEPKGGFLSAVLPKQTGSEFDSKLGWSSERGLYFDRGSTLEAAIPISTRLGPALLDELYANLGSIGGGGGGGVGGVGGVGGGGGGGGVGGGGGIGTEGQGIGGGDTGSGQSGLLAITTALSGTIEIGPVTARFDRMGITARQRESGAGPVDVAVDFEPPNGVGIEIDTGPVTGGGYLAHQPDRDRYVGSLTIEAAEFSLSAVGILRTELPDGSDGYSLLLVITANDLGIQLGAGFTLEGVGGLVGVNRTVKHRRLGNAVRTGAAESILFPTDPVANVDRIVSDLQTFFPSRAGHHVFGPLARISWYGVLDGKLGVVLELPTGKFVLAGVLSAGLPNAESGLIEINLAVTGYLNPPEHRLALDASLFESKLVKWPLTGDMSLRANWGEKPRFLLSIGGWHPRYDPPSGFPDMNRVSAVIGNDGGNPRVELSGYLAVTSNTFQFGAEAHAVLKAGPAKAAGHLALDTLFRFHPFKFVVDFSASLSVTVHGKGLTISIDGTISGPGPFRIEATLHIEILFLDLTVHANVTIGPTSGSEQLPEARVLPPLQRALEQPANWDTDLPDTETEWATLRKPSVPDGTIVAHPMGRIGVRQSIVPLSFDIERFRRGKPASFTRFQITGAETRGAALAFEATTESSFAPSKFLQMSSQEKLNSPAFETHPAGRRLAHDGVYCGFDAGDRERNSRTTTFGYECTVIDRPRDNWGVPLSELGRFATESLSPISGVTPSQLAALTAAGGVANADAREQGSDRFRLSEASRAAVQKVDSGDSAGDGGSRRIVRGGETPDEGGLAESISMNETSYVLVDADTLRRVTHPAARSETDLSKARAERLLGRLREDHPDLAAGLQVVASHRARPPAGGGPARPDGGREQSQSRGGDRGQSQSRGGDRGQSRGGDRS